MTVEWRERSETKQRQNAVEKNENGGRKIQKLEGVGGRMTVDGVWVGLDWVGV